jgi:hypothetical protein
VKRFVLTLDVDWEQMGAADVEEAARVLLENQFPCSCFVISVEEVARPSGVEYGGRVPGRKPKGVK